MTTETTLPRKSFDRLDRWYRLSVILLAGIVVAAILFAASRAAIYKIHEYERGLHLRGGRFLAVDQPGWHVQIPYVDTVILVKVNERLGYVERISTATADNLTMLVSLQFTYRVTDARTFALEVDDPERILFEFVQGKLRDVVNRQTMAEMMNARAAFNDVMLNELRIKEAQYGVQFVTVQIQSAEPPANVVQAIEDRMVATQREAQAEAEAAQQKIQADAAYYTAQKQAEAEAYQIQQRAVAQQQSVKLLLDTLSQHPDMASKYLDYLMTQELKTNSKWVIGQPGVDLQLPSETPVP
jgi:regulator of protease activity HflC (stomatin/prohibitin superfamily)